MVTLYHLYCLPQEEAGELEASAGFVQWPGVEVVEVTDSEAGSDPEASGESEGSDVEGSDVEGSDVEAVAVVPTARRRQRGERG